MLGRLGLVIHWLAFLLAELYLWLVLYHATLGSGVDGQDLITFIVVSGGCMTIGWLVNFILSGHRSPLPWVANKESNNG